MWLASGPKPSKDSNYSKTRTGVDFQSVCQGCAQIEILLDLHSEARKKGESVPTGRLPFHNDFSELSECARKCHTCRIFRQALLTRCATTDEAASLAEATRHCAVYARPLFNAAVESPQENTQEASLETSIDFKIDIQYHADKSVIIPSSTASTPALNLPENPNSPWITRQIKEWAGTCHRDHKQSCSALRWSSENPTRLIRIVSESQLQLCSVDKEVQYAALSYSWGSKFLNEKENTLLHRGMTTLDNIESRTKSFPLTDLPATLRDAVTLFRRIGLSYAWIDSVCIIQDQSDMSDFGREAPRMHRYYGNAFLTLAVCSNSKATEPMLSPRSAFSQVSQPCHLRGRYLLPPVVALGDMLKSSPLTQRAWTLQEEHLSPRILYWMPNKIYWSCAGAQLAEAANNTTPTEPNDSSQGSARDFLVACYHGTAEARHRSWLSMVTSYTLRDMSNPNDRFPALSGLASRYQSSSGQKNCYLSGLWELTLAHDLAWRVVHFVALDEGEPISSLPSWTWMSLPLGSGIEYDMDPVVVARFNFITSYANEMEGNLSQGDIYRGSLVTGLRISGRLRPLWLDEAMLCPWDSITDQEAGNQQETTSTKPRFSFWVVPESPVYSIDINTGLIVAYEARRKETVGQLDYSSSITRVLNGSLKIFALQLTEKDTLLVEKIDESHLRRVGMAKDYRPGFFDGVDIFESNLI